MSADPSTNEPQKWRYTPAEVHELRQELNQLTVELRQLRKELEARSVRAAEIEHLLSDMTPSGLAYKRVQHGEVKESIVNILEPNPDGLPLADLTELLRRRLTSRLHPRTPSSVLNRLKKDGVVERVGRRWKLVDGKIKQ